MVQFSQCSGDLCQFPSKRLPSIGYSSNEGGQETGNEKGTKKNDK